MPKIVLATLNARYIHCAFGLRYLWANLGELQNETALLEFTIQQPTLEILAAILEQQPSILGLGIYIWNLEETTRLVADLKQIRPDLTVVLGGPEVSYDAAELPIVQLADHVISGEADLEFARFCRQHLSSRESQEAIHGTGAIEHLTLVESCAGPAEVRTASLRLIGDDAVANSPDSVGSSLRPGIPVATSTLAPLPTLHDLQLPYRLYSDDDIAHRVIYVEASRGCPFTCEFCLSALEIPVRQFPLDTFLSEMEALLRRGARQFKFVDRTFNLNLRVSRSILEFFLERYQPGLFLHFEMIPDRLPEALRELIVRFPAGALQFEVGIQTFNSDVCALISRHQENDRVEQNLRWLRQATGVHIHADLIVGLPGESIESFAAGFDRLVRLQPHEIQVGILKRLRGTPIVRHDATWKMVYSPHPPYEILSNSLLNFSVVQELRRFAKYWDAVANSGNFVETLPLFWESVHPTADGKGAPSAESPFEGFRRFADWLYAQERKSHGIPLSRLLELVLQYLTEQQGLPYEQVAASLWSDYQRGGRSDRPKCLRPFLDHQHHERPPAHAAAATGPKRQARHRTD